jgi:hypothetical protein
VGRSKVYEKDAFQERVDFAAAVISRGGNTTRNYDTCFESNDGDSVAAALVRRANTNPGGKLAQNLFRYIDREGAEKAYEESKHLTHAELVKHAAEERSRAGKAFAEFLQKHRAEQEALAAEREAAAQLPW